ncbi:MAG: hypothetical protein F6J93_38720 [Oscillatoria sp. SIO1A7]|nr:hypothetical protein [Oscillatoria sp. SIO1A7]
MSPRSSAKFSLRLLLLLGLLVAPVRAHDVEVGTDVAATFHLEPNHNPRAGETAEVWFALTRRGGKTIPLDRCDCQLAVYSKPRSSEDEPLLEPELNAISVEIYRDIPGAEIVFPEAGSYELKLTGAPKEGNNFQPFELSFSVTVQP